MDLKFFKKSKLTLIFLIVFSAISIPVFYHLVKVDKKLKVYNPADVNPSLVHQSIKHITKDHTIADFELINQNGEIITNNNYKNKIYVADFFFTRCTNICIAMAYNMSELQEFYKKDNDIMFLSHSVSSSIENSASKRFHLPPFSSNIKILFHLCSPEAPNGLDKNNE